jgi:hypothetical protein
MDKVAVGLFQIALYAFCACRASQTVPFAQRVPAQDIQSLEVRKSHVMIDTIGFLPMGLGSGTGVLSVQIESAFLSAGKDTLICSGIVSDYSTRAPLSGIHIWAGRVRQRQSRAQNGHDIDTTEIPWYYMDGGVASFTDKQGHFELSTRLIGNTYMAVFDQAYFVKLYEIGLLVPDSIRLGVANPGDRIRGGRR